MARGGFALEVGMLGAWLGLESGAGLWRRHEGVSGAGLHWRRV